MVDEYQIQKDNQEYQEMTFDERFTLMIDKEYDGRINHTIERNIRNANFYDSTACLEDINYKLERKINKDQINEYFGDLEPHWSVKKPLWSVSRATMIT